MLNRVCTVCVNPLRSKYFDLCYSTWSDFFCLNLKTVGLYSTLAGNKYDRYPLKFVT
jgi:hypothetical protein